MKNSKLARETPPLKYTPHVKATDSELVRSHCSGDERAFGEIVQRYEKRLQNFIFGKIGDRELSEDLVQETFMRINNHAHRFNHSKQFGTWVYTIAGNLAKNELRNRSRNPLVFFHTLKSNWDNDDCPIDFEDTRAQTDELHTNNHLRMIINEAITQLPDHHKQAFELRELEGRSYEEISEIAGCSLGTVKSRLHRARDTFAELIEPFID